MPACEQSVWIVKYTSVQRQWRLKNARLISTRHSSCFFRKWPSTTLFCTVRMPSALTIISANVWREPRLRGRWDQWGKASRTLTTWNINGGTYGLLLKISWPATRNLWEEQVACMYPICYITKYALLKCLCFIILGECTIYCGNSWIINRNNACVVLR